MTIYDPRITAYALGELTPDERESFEREIKDRPDLWAEVSAMLESADLMKGVFDSAEPLHLDPSRRAAIFSQPAPNKVHSFPTLIPLLGGALAACFAIGLLVTSQSDSDDQGGAVATTGAPSVDEHTFSVSLDPEIITSGASPARGTHLAHSVPSPPDAPAATPSPLQGPALATSSTHQKSPTLGSPESGGMNIQFSSAPKKFRDATNFSASLELASATTAPVTSFPLGVLSDSLDRIKAALTNGNLPGAEDVRVEQLINQFTYTAPKRKTGAPLSVGIEVATCPWDEDKLLARVATHARGRANNAPGNVADTAAIEVVFDPNLVASYRLLGYAPTAASSTAGQDHESKPLILSGAIAPGQAVTALYEIVPVAATGSSDLVAASYPTSPTAVRPEQQQAPLGVDVYYQPPGSTHLRNLGPSNLEGPPAHWDSASDDFRFASAVAAFGLHLRGGAEATGLSLTEIADLAAQAVGKDSDGQRAAFVDMVRKANSLAQ